MQLENMVTEVKKVGENGIIVEFNNGYALAYERHSRAAFERLVHEQTAQTFWMPELSVTKEAVEKDNKLRLEGAVQYHLQETIVIEDSVIKPRLIPEDWEWGDGKLSPLVCTFSEEMQKAIANQPILCVRKVKDIDDRMRKSYSEIIGLLDIVQCKYMSLLKETDFWITPGVNLGCLALPLIPILVLYRAPTEIFAPSGQAYKIRKKKLLITNCNGSDPAIYADNNHYDEPPFMDPDRILRKETIHIQFPPTGEYDFFITLSGSFTHQVVRKNEKCPDICGYCEESPQKHFQKEKQWYKKSKYYLKVDEDLKRKVYEQAQARDVEYNNWQNFKEQLNKENQTALLKSIGFIQANV